MAIRIYLSDDAGMPQLGDKIRFRTSVLNMATFQPEMSPPAVSLPPLHAIALDFPLFQFH